MLVQLKFEPDKKAKLKNSAFCQNMCTLCRVINAQPILTVDL